MEEMSPEIIGWKRIPGGRNIQCKASGGRVPSMCQEHNGGQRVWSKQYREHWPKVRSEGGGTDGVRLVGNHKCVNLYPA